MPMRRLCFGGSFNPIHHAHLLCARAVAELAGFDRVVLIPSCQPPHKPLANDIAPASHRLEMCQLAAALQPDFFEVEDIEVRRAGSSYTIDTARELKRRGWDQVPWLIGADMLMYLPKWHEPEALLKEVRFVVMARPGSEIDWAQLPQSFQELRRNVVPSPLIDISATTIRRRVAEGKSIHFMTPLAVVDYIHKTRLYCNNTNEVAGTRQASSHPIS